MFFAQLILTVSMGGSGLDPDQIPVFRSLQDRPSDMRARAAVWQECVDNRSPYLAVEATEQGTAGIYDLSPVNRILTITAQQEMRRIIEASISSIRGDTGEPGVEIVLGRVNGKIVPLSVDRARELLSTISPILRDPSQWRDRGREV